MPDADFEAIRTALSSTHPHLKVKDITTEAQGLLKADVPDLEDIVQALSSIIGARSGTDISREQFVRDLRESLERRSDRPKQFDPAIFEKRVLALISIEPMLVSARAIDVQHEYSIFFIPPESSAICAPCSASPVLKWSGP